MSECRLRLKYKIDSVWGIYLCDCGNEIKCLINRINKGWQKSCGCIYQSHGLRSHPLYHSWCRMKSRCYNKKNKKYHLYGGKGVVVCDEWLTDFKAYYDWCMDNGWTDGLQVDKDIKGNGLLYSPSTCLVVTNKENCNKRSNTVLITRNGETKSIMQWCEFYGINSHTFYSRINTGWSFDKAITTPKLHSTKKYTGKI